MAKGDTQKKEDARIETEQKRNNSQTDEVLSPLKEQQRDLISQGNDERKTVLSGLGNFASTGGISKDQYDRFNNSIARKENNTVGSGGGGGGSTESNPFGGSAFNGIPNSAYKNLSGSDYRNLGDSAFQALPGSNFQNLKGSAYEGMKSSADDLNSAWNGVGPSAFKGTKSEAGGLTSAFNNLPASTLQGLQFNRDSAFNGLKTPDYSAAKAGFGSLADSKGGLSDSDIAGVNRNSLLENERTGGYSDRDIQNIRARTANNSPAFFQNIKNSMQRNTSASGINPGAGFDFKLARQGAQQAGQDRLAGEIGLADTIRAGKMDAAKTLAGNQLALSGLQSSNRIAGNTGLAGIADSEGRFDLARAGGMDSFNSNLNGLDLDRAKGIDANSVAIAAGKDNIAGQRASLMDNYAINSNTAMDTQDRSRANALDTMATARAGMKDTFNSNQASARDNYDMSRAGALDSYDMSRASGKDNFDLTRAGGNNSYDLARAGGQDQFDLSKAGGLDNYKNAQDQIGASRSAASAALSAQMDLANRSLDSDNARYLLGLEQSGKEYGMTGQQNMYGTSYAPSVTNTNQILAGLGQQGGLNNGTLGLNLQNDQVNSKWNGFNNIMNGIGTAAGVAGTVMTGLGGVKAPTAASGAASGGIPAGSFMSNASNVFRNTGITGGRTPTQPVPVSPMGQPMGYNPFNPQATTPQYNPFAPYGRG